MAMITIRIFKDPAGWVAIYDEPTVLSTPTSREPVL